MSQLARQLREELTGEYTESADALDYFSTDGSIFKIKPRGVIYPKNTRDVVTAVKLVAERAAAGEKINLIARGKGTDQAGGALGDGIMLVMPAAMNKVVGITKQTVTVQPGLLYGSLQHFLQIHGRFLPPYPSSIDFCSIGGAIANDACGEKTVKYGATHDFVKNLKVVLSDGSLIETKRISARALNHKKGQNDLEGEIYRGIDSLILDHAALIKSSAPHTSKNAAGYALRRVKHPDGSFDLSQLMVGSQGTLGIVVEAVLGIKPYNPKTTLVAAYFDDLAKAGQAVVKLKTLGPSALEIVDSHLLEFLEKYHPGEVEDLVPNPLPAIVLLIEFDDVSQVTQRLKLLRTQRLLERAGATWRVAGSKREQARLWKIRHSAAAVIWLNRGAKKALPMIEDGVVPVGKLPQFLEQTYAILKRHKLEIAVWGHAGDGHLHLQPFMDLSKASERDKVFKVAGEFYDMVLKLGGSTSGEHNDGLMRAPYLKQLYGAEMYHIFEQVKRIFDPQAVFNPRVKLGLTVEDVKPLLRHEYSMKHLYDHMPGT